MNKKVKCRDICGEKLEEVWQSEGDTNFHFECGGKTAMKNNQSNQRGGARPGAGRKKGSTMVISKKEILEALGDEFGKEDFVEILREMLKSKEFKRVSFAWEQIFGKAPQSIDHTSKGEQIQNYTGNIDEQLRQLESEIKALGMAQGKKTAQKADRGNKK